MTQSPLRRSRRILAGFGFAVVLVLVVVVVITAMSHDDAPIARPFAADLAGDGVLAVISMAPGGVGENEVHLFITPPGGSIIPVADAMITVTLGDTEVEAVLVRESANHYSGTIDFPSSGNWALELRVQIDATDTALLSTVVPVSAG